MSDTLERRLQYEDPDFQNALAYLTVEQARLIAELVDGTKDFTLVWDQFDQPDFWPQVVFGLATFYDEEKQEFIHRQAGLTRKDNGQGYTNIIHSELGASDSTMKPEYVRALSALARALTRTMVKQDS